MAIPILFVPPGAFLSALTFRFSYLRSFVARRPVSQLEENPNRESLLRWSYFSTFCTAGLQLLAACLITRFLQPKDYGLAAMAMLCSMLAAFFTQLGMDRALVQAPRLTTGNIRAAFTVSMATGLGGFALLSALSPLLGVYFKEPRLPMVIVAFALTLIFQASSMVAAGLLRREFRIRQLAICDILAYLLSTFGLGLPMAMCGFGVWALVASNVSQPMFAAIGYFLARPHPVLPTLRKADYGHVTSFGGKVTITTLVEALGGSMDTILLGRLVSAGSLGIYNRSATLSSQPIYALSTGLSRVFHPSIARAAERTLDECRVMLQCSERQLMAIIIPACIGASIAGPTIVPVVLGHQWTLAIPVYQVLCIDAALEATYHLPTIQLEVLSLFRNKFIVQLLYGTTIAIAIIITARFGIVAVACVHPVIQLVRTVVLHSVSARSLNSRLWSLLAVWFPGMLCGVAVGATVYFTQRELSLSSATPSALHLVILISVGILIACGFYRIFYFESVYLPWIDIVRLPQGQLRYRRKTSHAKGLIDYE